MSKTVNLSKTKTQRTVVIGSGGTGSFLLEGLVRTLEYKFPGSALMIIDGDSYEDKNKERQIFDSNGNKAFVKAAALQQQFEKTYVIPVPHWIVAEVPDGYELNDEETGGYIAAKDFFQDGDVVFAVVDNHAARKAIFDAAKNFDNISVFTGGNDDKLFGSTYHYQRRDGKEITDHPSIYHDEFVNPPDRNPAELSCEERLRLDGGTQLLAINMTIAGILLTRFHHVIIENNPDDNAEIFIEASIGKMVGFDRTADEADATKQEKEEKTLSGV